MRAAIVGGGPSGAMAAERLACAGWRVTVFEPQPGWEKPCGGGVTFKAYSRYPFLAEEARPRRQVRQARLETAEAGVVELALRDPILIYSRSELNQLLLARARAAGAAVEAARVNRLERRGAGWRIVHSCGVAEADFCIMAAGARNRLGETRLPLTASEALPALGYFAPHRQDHVDLAFLPDFEGYLWVFPRQDHVSAGIAGNAPAPQMRALLEDYLTRKGIAWRDAPFYGHLLPCLKADSWDRLRPCGEGWLAVGDAAGLVDPVTGEGIYYALRSGEMAAEALLAAGAEAAPERYRAALREEIGDELRSAARLHQWFFHGSVLGMGTPARMAQLARRSGSVAEVVQDLFAGTQPYGGLKARLKRVAPRAMLEAAIG